MHQELEVQLSSSLEACLQAAPSQPEVVFYLRQQVTSVLRDPSSSFTAELQADLEALVAFCCQLVLSSQELSNEACVTLAAALHWARVAHVSVATLAPMLEGLLRHFHFPSPNGHTELLWLYAGLFPVCSSAYPLADWKYFLQRTGKLLRSASFPPIGRFLPETNLLMIAEMVVVANPAGLMMHSLVEDIISFVDHARKRCIAEGQLSHLSLLDREAVRALHSVTDVLPRVWDLNFAILEHHLALDEPRSRFVVLSALRTFDSLLFANFSSRTLDRVTLLRRCALPLVRACVRPFPSFPESARRVADLSFCYGVKVLRALMTSLTEADFQDLNLAFLELGLPLVLFVLEERLRLHPLSYSVAIPPSHHLSLLFAWTTSERRSGSFPYYLGLDPIAVGFEQSCNLNSLLAGSPELLTGEGSLRQAGFLPCAAAALSSARWLFQPLSQATLRECLFWPAIVRFFPAETAAAAMSEMPECLQPLLHRLRVLEHCKRVGLRRAEALCFLEVCCCC